MPTSRDPDPSDFTQTGLTPTTSIFRRRALDAHAARTREFPPVKPPRPWPYWVILTSTTLLLAAGAIIAVAKVEVTGRARAVVRPLEAGIDLTARVGGTIKEFRRAPGETVRQGEVIAVIASPDLSIQAMEAASALQSVQRAESAKEEIRQSSLQERLQHLRLRLASIKAQETSARQSLALAIRKQEAQDRLAKEGLVSAIAAAEAGDAVGQAKRSLESVLQAKVALQTEQTQILSQTKEAALGSTQAIDQAETRLHATEMAAQEAVLIAPVDGEVDALPVKVGETVAPGRLIGRIIPAGATRVLVAYADEKDCAYLRPHAAVRIEWDTYPYAIWGSSPGVIRQIGGDLAPSADITRDLGTQAPGPLVRLEVTPLAMPREVTATPRFGSQAQVRYVVRRQRLLAMLFAPLRKWLDR